MIKIIDQPTHFEDTCYKCGCEYSYEYEDINESLIMAGDYFTVCPVCKIQNSHRGDTRAVYGGYAE
jgi:hypothetical protein